MSEQPQMSRIGFPLSPYDMLGYLIPGGAFLLCVYLFEFWGSRLPRALFGEPAYFHTPLITALEPFIKGESKPWGLAAILLMVLVASAYIIAHIIATVSSILADRILIAKGYGYPYVSLLNLGSGMIGDREMTSRAFYRGFVFWVNSFFLCLYCKIFFAYLFPGSTIAIISLFGTYVTIGIVLLTSIGKIIISTGYFRVEGSNGKAQIGPTGRRIERAVRWWICAIFVRIYDLGMGFLSRCINTQQSLNPDFIEYYKKCFSKRFGFESESAGTNNYWFSFMHVKNSCPLFGQLIDNWLRLYAFSRNLSTAFFLASAYGFISLWYQASNISKWNDYHVMIALLLPAVYFCLSMIMLFRYYYLYVHYYSKFIFRSFVYICKTEESRFKTAPMPATGGATSSFPADE